MTMPQEGKAHRETLIAVAEAWARYHACPGGDRSDFSTHLRELAASLSPAQSARGIELAVCPLCRGGGDYAPVNCPRCLGNRMVPAHTVSDRPPEQGAAKGGDAASSRQLDHSDHDRTQAAYSEAPVEKSAGAASPPAFTWPEGIADKLVLPCADCGHHTLFDYTVADEFWQRHVPDMPAKISVVCLPCLDRRCSGIGLADAIERVQWTGTGHTVVLEPRLRHVHASPPASPYPEHRPLELLAENYERVARPPASPAGEGLDISREFKNENGAVVILRAKADRECVWLEMHGPTTSTTNYITRLEAERFCDVLAEVLGRRPSPPASAVGEWREAVEGGDWDKICRAGDRMAARIQELEALLGEARATVELTAVSHQNVVREKEAAEAKLGKMEKVVEAARLYSERGGCFEPISKALAALAAQENG